MFDEYYQKRNARSRDKVRAIQKEADREVAPLVEEDLTALIMEDPNSFLGKSGHVSPSKVKLRFKVPYNRAQSAAQEATQQLKLKLERERAEKEAV
jgi:hypothetical protein